MSNNKNNKTLTDLLLTAIDEDLYKVNTCIPGIVDSFNATDKTVNVIPAIKRVDKDGEVVTLPIIEDVPIAYMQAKNGIISIPIEKDDPVLIVFSQRAIDKWKNDGGIVDPTEVIPRRHNMSDAIAIPGISTIGGGQAVDPDLLTVKYFNSTISIDRNDVVTIDNNTTSIVLDGDSALIDNGSGTIELKSSGQVDINGNLTVDV